MYGVLVIGAPGAGKSTFCAGLADIFEQINRPHVTINLDPANDFVQYNATYGIKELITVEDVMDRLGLGPNGALKYCMSTLCQNRQWLLQKILENKDKYTIIDCPGQLELYKSEGELWKLIRELESAGVRLCALHLVDSLYCADAAKFISVVMSTLASTAEEVNEFFLLIPTTHPFDQNCAITSIDNLYALNITKTTMVTMEMPQVNILSKIDLFDEDAPFNLDYFTHLPDVNRLLELLNEVPGLERYHGLNAAICDVITSFDLVSFVPLNVQKKEDMAKVLRLADTANGWAFHEQGDIREMVTK